MKGLDQLCFKCGIIGHVDGDCGETKHGSGEEGEIRGVVKERRERPAAAVRAVFEEEHSTTPGQGKGGKGIFTKGIVVEEQGGQCSLNNGVQKNVEAKESGKKPMVEECREDRGYGEWTLVQRRKSLKPSLPKGEVVGKPKGDPFKGSGKPGGKNLEGIMRFAAVNSGGETQGEEVSMKASTKPLLVYTRVGGSSLEKIKGGGIQFRRKGVGDVTLRRPKMLFKEGNKGTGAGGFPERSGVAGSVVLDSDGGPLAGEDEGVRKRRRGEEQGSSGGDASPLGLC